jgi:hypothetical protein
MTTHRQPTLNSDRFPILPVPNRRAAAAATVARSASRLSLARFLAGAGGPTAR